MSIEVNEIYSSFLEISIFIFLAELLGTFMSRLGFPKVIAEVTIGIMLSPYALGGLINSLLGIKLFTINNYIILFSELSVILLIFASGLDHGFSSLRKSGIHSALGAVFGAILPVISSLVVFSIFYPFYSALLIATATGATSVSVIASIIEKEAKNDEIASFVLSAAVIDDVVDLVLLSISLSIITSEVNLISIGLSALKAIVSWLVILAVSLLVIPKIFKNLKDAYIEETSLLILFALIVIMGILGFSPVIASFIAGVAIAETVKVEKVKAIIRVLLSIFGSLFFVIVGAEFNLSILSLNVLVNSLILTGLASIFKVIGFMPFIYMKILNLKKSLIGSFGMIPRGEVGLIIGSIGYSMNVLNQEEYGIIILMSLLTTVVGAILFKKYQY